MRSFLGLLLAAAACGETGPTMLPGSVDSILVVSPPSLTLAIGEARQLSAVVVIDETDTAIVQPEWVSRSASIATVTDAGIVMGAGAGETFVIGTIAGLRDSTRATVTTGGTVNPPRLQPVVSGLSVPVFATAPPGDVTRLFVVEKTGTIRVVRNDTLLASPFLDISALVSTGGEQGLLSLAFHPDYATNGYVYVSYTDTAGDSRVVRYHAQDAETADATTATLVLGVAQPYGNHNGGPVAFGPDRMLYIGLGDGGSGGDPDGNGQNRGTLLGSVLRIDVDAASPYAIPSGNPFVGTAGARGEIWAYGLRNPWRFSFDRATGDLYIADVGQNAREEVNVQPAASMGGENYGWNVMEGTTCYAAATCQTQGLVLPVLDYPHTEGCSVTGGYVYRGSTVPALAGQYLFSDYCTGWVRSFTYAASAAGDRREWPELSPGTGVTSFGEDARGELYVMTAGGALYRIASN